MTDRIEQLRAEQEERLQKKWEVIPKPHELKVAEAALTEALDIADDLFNNLGDEQARIEFDKQRISKLNKKLAEQERLLERAKELFERESLRDMDERTGELGPVRSPGIRQFLTDLDARGGK